MTLRHLVALVVLVTGCSAASRASVPASATAIEAEGHRACSCVLLHVTASAAPSRAIDRAAIQELVEKNPTVCAYEVLTDDRTLENDVELRPYLDQGAPVDLAFRPGESKPKVVQLTDGAVRATCS